MKVGLLLNKDVKDLPNLNNNFKIQRNKLKEKNREIEHKILFKKCHNFFKEMGFKNQINNINNINNNIPRNIFPDKLKTSRALPRINFPDRLKTSIALPLINIPNLEIENINNNEKSKNENNSLSKNILPKSEKNINHISKTNIKSISMKKAKKPKNIYLEKINKRLKMHQKTLEKLKKPLFVQRFKYDENTNNINIII